MKTRIYYGLLILLSFILAYQLIYWHHWNANIQFLYLVSVLIIIWTIFLSYLHKKKKKNPWMMSSSIRKHYQNILTKSEMNLFLKQMYDMRQLLLQFENIFNEDQSLNKLNQQYAVLDNLLFIYTYLLKYPKELLMFSQLLYRQLPSLKVMLTKYIEINRHYFKDKKTKISLKNAKQSMIDIMTEIQCISMSLQGAKKHA